MSYKDEEVKHVHRFDECKVRNRNYSEQDEQNFSTEFYKKFEELYELVFCHKKYSKQINEKVKEFTILLTLAYVPESMYFDYDLILELIINPEYKESLPYTTFLLTIYNLKAQHIDAFLSNENFQIFLRNSFLDQLNIYPTENMIEFATNAILLSPQNYTNFFLENWYFFAIKRFNMTAKVMKYLNEVLEFLPENLFSECIDLFELGIRENISDELNLKYRFEGMLFLMKQIEYTPNKDLLTMIRDQYMQPMNQDILGCVFQIYLNLNEPFDIFPLILDITSICFDDKTLAFGCDVLRKFSYCWISMITRNQYLKIIQIQEHEKFNRGSLLLLGIIPYFDAFQDDMEIVSSTFFAVCRFCNDGMRSCEFLDVLIKIVRIFGKNSLIDDEILSMLNDIIESSNEFAKTDKEEAILEDIKDFILCYSE